jgi:hypothetical protein
MPAMRRTVLAFVLLLSACASVPAPSGVQGISDRLYCGRAIPGGGEVTDADIDRFVEEVVTPRFPEGFTMWTATGSWRGKEEPTLVLEFLHPYGRGVEEDVREIAEEYRRRFRQEAVLRVTLPAIIELVEAD